MHTCPALHYDGDSGYYYETGGGERQTLVECIRIHPRLMAYLLAAGETQHGPFRSRNLINWEVSPIGPLTENSHSMVSEVTFSFLCYYSRNTGL
eukprot:SAG31_NODE_1450_length_8307_cov_3.676657_6_plen_94_part_00